MTTILASITIDPIKIVMQSTLHIGAGHGRGLIDNAVVRDHDGQVYIPGSSFKGKVREACELLAKSQDLDVCQAPNPRYMCGSPEAPVPAQQQPCIVCRIFGAPGGSSEEWLGLYWDNAYLDPAIQQAVGKRNKAGKGQLALSYSRTQAGMSRARGTAHEGLLFTSEFAAEQLTFQTRLTGCLPLTLVADQPERYYETILLVAGLKLVETLGGSGSRGAGRCRIELPERIRIHPQESVPEEPESNWLIDRLELLSLYKEEMAA